MFELHISCSKDFDSLNIKFSDGSVGTFSGVENNRSEKTQKSLKEPKKTLTEHSDRSDRTNTPEKIVKPEKLPENFIDHFEKPKSVSNLPDIPDITEVSVDPDLNDLEI